MSGEWVVTMGTSLGSSLQVAPDEKYYDEELEYSRGGREEEIPYLPRAFTPLTMGAAVQDVLEPEAFAAAEVGVILPFEKSGDYYVEQLGEVLDKPVYSFFKRAFDITASGCALIILLIPLLIIALAVKCSSPGKVFYSQERLGKNGKRFNIIKFRSMYENAEEKGAQWSTGESDPRITPVGAVLRKFRLDELPQFWCIFRGHMTFVGPRPERECFYDQFETYIHGFHERLKVKPGLTGLAQVNGGYDLKPEEKIVFDIDYIKRRSLLLDLKIIFKTAVVVFTHRGAK